jgi:hypothetical protein
MRASKILPFQIPQLQITPPSNEIPKNRISSALPALKKDDLTTNAPKPSTITTTSYIPTPNPSQPFSPTVPKDKFVQVSGKSRCCNIL